MKRKANYMTTFHQWYYSRHVNDELNLIWSGWFLWITDWHVEQMKRRSITP